MKKQLSIFATAVSLSILASCGGATEGKYTQAQIDSITKFQTDSIATAQKAVIDSIANVEAQRQADSTRAADSLAQLHPNAAPTRSGGTKPEAKPATTVSKSQYTTAEIAPSSRLEAAPKAQTSAQQTKSLKATTSETVEAKKTGDLKAQPEKK